MHLRTPTTVAILTLALGTLATVPNLASAQATLNVWPGPDVQERLQSALINANPGDLVKLGEGTFRLTDGLSLDVDGVTVQGAGRNRTRLIFSEQESAGEGLQVTSDNVVLSDFAVLDTRSDGIKVQGCKNITLRRLRVEWTRGPNTENGAYGLYPVECSGVLIEQSIVIGASDAGIYVGQSENIVVRNNTALRNVAGLEIENSYNADVYQNLLQHNTAGILVFDLPNLPQQGGHSVRVFSNRSQKNDTPNFGAPGTSVGDVPVGIGIMVMANSHVEVFDNNMSDNATANLLITSYHDDYDDGSYNPYPSEIYVHGNRFGNGGHAPDAEKAQPIADLAGSPVPDIVWDGVMPFFSRLFGGQPAVILGPRNLRTDGSPATFVNLDLVPWATPAWNWFHAPDFDHEKYSGERDSLPAVELDF